MQTKLVIYGGFSRTIAKKSHKKSKQQNLQFLNITVLKTVNQISYVKPRADTQKACRK